jgi:hypothetical protein
LELAWNEVCLGGLHADEAQPRRLEKLMSLTLTPGPAAEAGSDASAHTPTLGQPQPGASPARDAASPGAAAAGQSARQERGAGFGADPGSRRGSGVGAAAPLTQDSGAEALTAQQAGRGAASPSGPRDLGSYFGARGAAQSVLAHVRQG